MYETGDSLFIKQNFFYADNVKLFSDIKLVKNWSSKCATKPKAISNYRKVVYRNFAP